MVQLGLQEAPCGTVLGGWLLALPLLVLPLHFGVYPDLCLLIASSDDMTLTSPSMDNSSAELLPSGDSPLNKRMTENLLASLSEHERAAILSVPAAQNPEDLRMFARWGLILESAKSKRGHTQQDHMCKYT